MIKLLFLLITILTLDFIYTVILNIKFGKAMPITLITFFFICFVSGIIGNLSMYKIAIPLFIIVSAIYIYVKKKTIKLNNFFNISFWCFIIVFFYSWFLFKNKGLDNIDDLFHWSLSVNTIIKSGTLYPVGWYVNSYPPFVTWYISMICYILGGYSESYCLFALSNLCVSFIYPFLDKFSFKVKNILPFILTFFTLVFTYLCVNITEHDQLVFVFNSIYIDWIMSILYAYLIYLVYIYKGSTTEAIYFSFIAVALVLTKQVSIPLTLVAIFSLFIKQTLNKKTNVFNIIYIAIIPFAIYICWSLFNKNSINLSSTVLTRSIDIVANATSSLFTNTSYSIEIVYDFIKAFFTKDIIFHPIHFSYFFYITILFIIQIMVGVILKESKSYYSTSIILYLGSFGYALVILMSYITFFSDGYSLPLYSRYMQTYTFAYLLICVYLTIEKNIMKLAIPTMVLVILSIEPLSIDTLTINPSSQYYKINEREKINQYVKDIYNNEKLITLAQTNMKYSNAIKFIFYDNKKYKNISSFQVNINSKVDEVKKILSNNEYLLIIDYDSLFSNYWGQITDTPLYNSTIYKISSNEDELDIQLIEIFEDTKIIN